MHRKKALSSIFFLFNENGENSQELKVSIKKLELFFCWSLSFFKNFIARNPSFEFFRDMKIPFHCSRASNFTQDIALLKCTWNDRKIQFSVTTAISDTIIIFSTIRSHLLHENLVNLHSQKEIISFKWKRNSSRWS